MTFCQAIIESNQIKLSPGYNYFDDKELNISLIPQGYVPIIRLVTSVPLKTVNLYTKQSNDLYPDYVCFNMSTSTGDLIGLNNCSNVSILVGIKRTNIAVLFRFEEPTLINITLSSFYSSFGIYQPYLYTDYGNLYMNLNHLITITNDESYQYQSKL